ncbi:MAG: tRNA (N(6)-L-threonylcarbamoyladenosine(37)-C(2))-methylthiotransferase MtaB [Bacteroidales bacterium]|nr:tRNA (N(6)-L-threonylcarbamoyladenosine(37)-C(2))-methylthiotransferase MtaB [Bacteroidales bacterium]
MEKTRIAFQTLGCKLNYAETSTYERGFTEYGLETVPWEEKADVYLINTCSVTERAEKKCRNIIRKMHRVSPEAIIVIAGCYAELRKEELQKIEGVSLVFGAKEKPRVVRDTMALLRGEEFKEIEPKETFAAFSSEERTRSFLKVQDGCNNFCAYCTVPFARGRSRNIPIEEVIAQAEKIAESGIKEVVITGVNTGDFGRTTGETFLDLLKRLDKVDGTERYRISSIEPNLITEEIINWIASGTKFQPHFHIPLQSGSDTILKRVGRRYDTAFFADRIDYIRSVMDPRPGEPGANLKPYVFFGIDVIAGLPGETDELFEETYNFLKDRVKPAFIHVFPYSRRPGTVAAGWKDQVKDSVKTERVARLEELCRELNTEFIEKNRGRHSQVLWESDVKDGKMGGYTGNYIRLERSYDPALVNMIEDTII